MNLSPLFFIYALLYYVNVLLLIRKYMSTLCQIAKVNDEKYFMDYVKQHNYPPDGSGGWGRFTGEVPAIGTTLQIDWSDTEVEEGSQRSQRASDYFKVIYHHRHLIPGPDYGSLASRHHVNVCMVYVIAVEI